ncbi:metallophosphoesterase [Bacteroides ilei]|jgi:predicted MPP superfamily phosphohydrolase|uniref:metallophosphoesterase n=1 Tax=Bacteroides ilei TaxID=1907658 RepID=UPI0009318E41|nr:metallophosphoesterase [Bacteroides ilei]
MGKIVHFIFLISIVLLSSCATASFSKYHGIGRIKKYTIYSEQLPDSFDGFRIAFASDFHYESRFNRKRLPGLLKALQATEADVLLLGGDYRGRNGGNLTELFDLLHTFRPPYGTYGVMGNHENNANYEIVKEEMKRTGIHLLEHEVDTLWKENEYILLCGIRNPFDLKQNGVSPTLNLHPDDYVIMLVHTPDYAEDTDISNTDLVLAGHTHGGQVSFFKRYTPAHFSKYGTRFMTGLKHNSAGIPVIITNGIGTSRKDIRLFTPSEIVLITLHKF